MVQNYEFPKGNDEKNFLCDRIATNATEKSIARSKLPVFHKYDQFGGVSEVKLNIFE